MHSLLSEIRQACRALWAEPAWTMAALACLALGTGANTATFNVINGLLLRPLPFEEPEQIVMMAIRGAKDQKAGPVSVEQYRELREAAPLFQQISVRTFLPVGIAADGPARMAQAEFVGTEYFDLLRLRPLAGRFFSAAPAEAILSERLWRTRFNRDAGVVGRTVRVNGRPVTIAGVAPAGFVGAMRIVAADVWMPVESYGSFASPEAPREAESRPVFGVIGRLKPGLTAEQTKARFDAFLATRWRVGESLIEVATGFGVPPGLRTVAMGGSAILFGLMALLVAVAVANVAGLTLARATGRRKETAIRLALGASRFRIVRQVLVESLILALGGALLGAMLASALPSLLSGLGPTLPEHLSMAVDIRPDWRTAVYSTLTAVAIAVLFGLAPARQAAGTQSNLALRESAGNSRTRATARSLNAFVVGQVAVSTVLLVVAILLGRTYMNMQAVDPGIDIRNTLTVSLDWDQTGADRAKGRLFFEQLVARVSTMAGVEGVALTRLPPLSPAGGTVSISAEGSAPFPAGTMVVTPAYFDAVRLPLVQGRAFRSSDNGTAPVAIVNETMAKQLSASESPVGKVFSLGTGSGRRLEVIGVAKDTKYRTLSETPAAVFYEPFSQTYSPRMTLLIRTVVAPDGLIGPVRREIELQNRDLAVVAIRTLEEQFRESAAPSMQRAVVLAMTCGLGLLLSAFGLFGVMSYGVRQRTREFGVRIAMGARPGDIAVLVLRQVFSLVGLGLAIGLTAAFATARFIASALFGVGPQDPLTLALVVGVLAVVALAAAYLPARWAARVDPVRCIRAE